VPPEAPNGYATEGEASLLFLEARLGRLASPRFDPLAFDAALPVAQSLAQTAAFLGHDRVAALAAAIRRLLLAASVRARPLPAAAAEQLCQAGDAIHRLLRDIERFGAEPPGDDRALIRRLDRLRRAA